MKSEVKNRLTKSTNKDRTKNRTIENRYLTIYKPVTSGLIVFNFHTEYRSLLVLSCENLSVQSVIFDAGAVGSNLKVDTVFLNYLFDYIWHLDSKCVFFRRLLAHFCIFFCKYSHHLHPLNRRKWTLLNHFSS